ncbi:MAG: C40 family peptidase [Acidimicrobiales bacterium]
MAGAESRSRLWRRLGAGALSVAALASGPWVSAAAADPTASLQSEAQAMAARLNSLNALTAREDEALNQALNREAGIQSQLVAARSAVATAKDAVASDRLAVQQQAILAYVDGGSPSSLEQILQSSESSVALRQSYLDSITASEQSSVDALRGALVTLGRRQSRLQDAEGSAAAAVDQVRSAWDASARAAAAEQSALGRVKGRLADLVAQIDARQQAAEMASFAGQGSGASLPPPSGAGASVAVAWAQRELGKPYVYGAAGPNSFDCSGLTMYVWGKAGVSLPHSAAAQWDDTVRVPISDLAPGDLVFYYQPVDHVGIYAGGGEMIVAPSPGSDVQYQSIFEPGLDGGGRVG